MNKKMSQQARKELLANMQAEYQSGDWTTKNQLLDSFILATGYERKYAIHLLNGKAAPVSTKNCQKGRPVCYDESVVQVLRLLWSAANQICSKRLIPFLPELIESLERHGHLHLSNDVKERVLSVSASTLDRLLHKEKDKPCRGLSTTQSGTLLKKQIKVRTFSDWDEDKPGFFEGDLVAHCGTSVVGVFLNTLVMTDIVTTWTECIPLIRKSSDDVILGLETTSKLLPFNILGIDVDNGCEFINYDVLNYCKENNITFTRSRAYKKNDQAHVEEKNGSIVRRLVGYDRYETEAAWEAISRLYAVLRLYVNFFQPSLKLLDKKRVGSKTVKKYDLAKTPYQRVMLSEHITQQVKDELTEQYHSLDPMMLKKQLNHLQEELWKHAWTSEITPVENELECHDGEIQKSPRFYRKAKKTPRERDWRTRKDPFEHVQSFIELELQLNPNSHAKAILEKLIKKYPGDFCKGHLRTLQRRVADIRVQQDNRRQKYEELMVSQKSMTTLSLPDNL